MISRSRCFGDDDSKALLAQYHDEEWGAPVHDDCQHFEMLILEGAQAGLNWETILKKSVKISAILLKILTLKRLQE